MTEKSDLYTPFGLALFCQLFCRCYLMDDGKPEFWKFPDCRLNVPILSFHYYRASQMLELGQWIFHCKEENNSQNITPMKKITQWHVLPL